MNKKKAFMLEEAIINVADIKAQLEVLDHECNIHNFEDRCGTWSKAHNAIIPARHKLREMLEVI